MDKKKGAWLENLLQQTDDKKNKRKKQEIEIDPYEVEFMYRPPGPEITEETASNEYVLVNVQGESTIVKQEDAPKYGAPMGLRPISCWKCGKYGHVAADRECPKFNVVENAKHESFLKRIEDPMHDVVSTKNSSGEWVEKKNQVEQDEALKRVEYYKLILEKEKMREMKEIAKNEVKTEKEENKKNHNNNSPNSSSSSSSESSSTSSSSSTEESPRRHKSDKRKIEKRDRNNKSKKKRSHRSSSTSSSNERREKTSRHKSHKHKSHKDKHRSQKKRRKC